MLDPSHLESQVATGTLTLSLNAQTEICVLSKAGGVPLPADTIMRAVNVAMTRARDVDELIRTALEADAKKNVIELR